VPKRLEQFIEDPSKQLKEQSRIPHLQGSEKQEEGIELPVDAEVSPEGQGSSFQPQEPLRECRPPRRVENLVLAIPIRMISIHRWIVLGVCLMIDC